MKRIAALLLVCFALGAAGEWALGQDSDDPHANQPAKCDNFARTPAEHRCHCAKSEHSCDDSDPDEEARLMKEPGSKCKTYCRPEACQCISPCNT